MKILLSAYACEPNKGSEPGVGWHWALELSKLGHEVWVLTRANNKKVIKKEFEKNQQPSNLHFLYYDLPPWSYRWKKGNHGIHLYYLLWQWGAYKVAKKIHNKEQFNLVHHVTFVSVRQPSFMGNLGIPFIFGPVAGGEKAPWRLRFHYGMRGFLIDAIRDIMNLCVKFDPLMWRTFSQAQKIYATSEQTKQLIPTHFHQKTKLQLAIGLDRKEISKQAQKTNHPDLKILFVGQFLYLKGMGLGIQAFAQFVQQFPGARLTMVGDGPDCNIWQQLTKKLNIANQVDWIPWVNRKELTEIYRRHDIFLFPSLHDSGGMVVLEAMAQGLAVICLKLGGPDLIVNDSCGLKVATVNRTEKEIIGDLSTALLKCSNNPTFLHFLKYGALKQADNFNWHRMVSSIYNKKYHKQ